METNNRNWIAFQVECERRARLNYRLRLAVFTASALVVAAVALAAWCWIAPAVLGYELREQELMQDEYEGLQAAYDAELLAEIERGLGK